MSRAIEGTHRQQSLLPAYFRYLPMRSCFFGELAARSLSLSTCNFSKADALGLLSGKDKFIIILYTVGKLTGIPVAGRHSDLRKYTAFLNLQAVQYRQPGGLSIVRESLGPLWQNQLAYRRKSKLNFMSAGQTPKSINTRISSQNLV